MPFIKQKFFIKEPIKAIKFLKENFNLTQKEAQKIIDKSRIYMNGKAFLDKSGHLSGNIEFDRFKGQALGIKAIFKTRDFALYDKPQKLLVHPKGRFYHISLLDNIKFDFGDAANPINRLDFETSGILLVSLNKQSEIDLKKIFETRQVKKLYVAIVFGKIKNCIIDLNILEQDKSKDLGIRSIVHKAGKRSISEVKLIYYDKITNISLIKIKPITGRTHQIRIHLNHIGHRILGECLYGINDNLARDYLNCKINENQRKELFGAERLMLHSQNIEFEYKNIRFNLSSKINFKDSNLERILMGNFN